MIAADTVETVGSVPLPLVIAVVGVVGTIAVAAMTAALAKFGEATARRRDGYAQAVRNLVRWREYPYRIRRRTGDDAQTLASLAAEGHSIQEDLRCSETWVMADKPWAGALYREVRTAMSSSVGEACSQAWQAGPVTSAQEMNLNGFGPDGAEEQLLRFEQAVRFRFGLRRLVAPIAVVHRPRPILRASAIWNRVRR